MNFAIAALLSAEDTTIRLTCSQRDALVSLQERLAEQARAAWVPVAKQLAAVGDSYDVGDISRRIASAEATIAEHSANASDTARSILTPEQIRRLPTQVARQLNEARTRRRTGLLEVVR